MVAGATSGLIDGQDVVLTVDIKLAGHHCFLFVGAGRGSLALVLILLSFYGLLIYLSFRHDVRFYF